MRPLILVLLLAGCATARPNLTVTGSAQQLTRITSDPVDELRPQISPDGKTLLFHTTVMGEESIEQQTIVGVDPETGARRTLFTPNSSLAREPAWLPDGSSFVYTSNSPGTWSLVRALSSAPNAAVTMIVSGDVAPAAALPSVSPDGTRVAFGTQVKGIATLAVIGLDGSRLTFYGEGFSPSWSPDGKRIAFVRRVGEHLHLFSLDPSTGTNVVQITSGDYEEVLPSWAPDSSQLVFSSNRGWDQNGRSAESTYNLFTVKADGTGLSRLTQGEGKASFPAWGRDGWIYFTADVSGNEDIWRLRPFAPVALPPPVASGPLTGMVSPLEGGDLMLKSQTAFGWTRCELRIPPNRVYRFPDKYTLAPGATVKLVAQFVQQDSRAPDPQVAGGAWVLARCAEGVAYLPYTASR